MSADLLRLQILANLPREMLVHKVLPCQRLIYGRVVPPGSFMPAARATRANSRRASAIFRGPGLGARFITGQL
jgi:hypothetical protein